MPSKFRVKKAIVPAPPPEKGEAIENDAGLDSLATPCDGEQIPAGRSFAPY